MVKLDNFCSNCKSFVSHDYEFCGSCGARITQDDQELLPSQIPPQQEPYRQSTQPQQTYQQSTQHQQQPYQQSTQHQQQPYLQSTQPQQQPYLEQPQTKYQQLEEKLRLAEAQFPREEQSSSHLKESKSLLSIVIVALVSTVILVSVYFAFFSSGNLDDTSTAITEFYTDDTDEITPELPADDVDELIPAFPPDDMLEGIQVKELFGAWATEESEGEELLKMWLFQEGVGTLVFEDGDVSSFYWFLNTYDDTLEKHFGMGDVESVPIEIEGMYLTLFSDSTLNFVRQDYSFPSRELISEMEGTWTLDVDNTPLMLIENITFNSDGSGVGFNADGHRQYFQWGVFEDILFKNFPDFLSETAYLLNIYDSEIRYIYDQGGFSIYVPYEPEGIQEL